MRRDVPPGRGARQRAIVRRLSPGAGAAALALVAAVAARRDVGRVPPSAWPNLAIDVNAADRGALELLPGVGPSLARAIVEDRERAGPFARVDDLDRVRGIGPGLLARMRPYARAGAAPGVPAYAAP